MLHYSLTILATTIPKERPHSEEPGLRLPLSLGDTIQLLTDDTRMRVFVSVGWVSLC